MRFSEIKSICAVCGQTPCNCTHVMEGETPEKEIERLKLRQNAWRNPGLKHQADTQARIRELEKQIADKKQGVAEAQGSVGAAIKSLYQKIYRAGDDEIDFFYHASPIFAHYWDEYEGDLDSIIAEVDPSELEVIKAELESYVDDANLAEGKPEKPERPEADYGDDYQAMVSRVKKLAGLGPLKTVYDPQKRVYKNVPTAVQPGDKK